MTSLLALSPLILVCATAIVVMLTIAWRRHHELTATLTVVGLNLALAAQVVAWWQAPVSVTPLMTVDGLAVFGGVLILIATLACATLGHAYLEGAQGPREEYYLLLLCAAAGGLALVSSRHLAALFFGLELLSMPLYGMLAYTYRERGALEAGIKYMVLSAAASAFLLFGMALLYSRTGHLDFAGLGEALATAGGDGWLMAGMGMMLIGLGFKLSIVPFHLWTPDVYEGSPAPAATFLASASKVAVLLVLLRLLQSSPVQDAWLHSLLAVLAFVTMLVGNLLALTQNDLKRLLGYSSIAHFGYLLVALVVNDGLAAETAALYLVTYVLTTLGAFGVVTLLSSPYSGADASQLHHYRGLFWRRPYLTAVLTVMMLSLAGIPFTAGFIGKFYIVAVGVEASRWWLVGGVVAGSAIGLYYYLRVMVTLFLPEPGMQRRDATTDWAQRAGGVVVLGLAALVVVLGVYPAPMIDWVRFMVAG
ncbi:MULTISPECIES: NADH-quinone oxidoreductase subunit NuoN [Chromohalobacter]|uniref:NADH-quinone oxidoreductase subunit N n=1 Tax=Chromohalobacter israelensis (strain ATCC BAA-138 / DSM 3043 / CIP 106854 / NCIMB 13768 / 1H11) TaxID=290398 RepID=NUON_CHRI1|nr:NADH-quinone oxidoreductase subunit NuoN [Chromohalobacter salexigens]Q1QSU4.1 RecName: Full=NADH-quinone oxidoreductase subunit N; AltName: Full=NADH dehydrogenase I subunit N; AltName: Full=NDH-1 subunit N [Chromohalobacter salexigens DSM 3043]ABE60464.1 NADH dehydrogenase subunit N [Chromohalobacter salexigens DSM 3043]MBZ5874965.1 NADH-quinone oxidoreductase subunit NuoN [Chromohalobacter salexigens]MDO0945691.1 NADH-quinone oxidoreductase subunit NuoN [Chromohalobacter salexigens]NWO57